MSRYFNDYNGPRGGYNNMDDNMNGYEDDEYSWNGPMPGLMDRPMFNRNGRDMRRARYDNAYGDYRGGYGPGGGYGPRPMMPPPPQLLMPPPPSMMPPPPSMMPPPNPGMWGRSFGSRGPSRRRNDDDRAIKYLMRCGVTKDNLKNLPRDLLALIEPEHCGLCDFSFESFIMSRVHYVSKNHLKNQKKWLYKSQGNQQEMPLKTRSLYCELCDIPITSQAHGDAHYAGKPHRGIVDGRKKPKNPMLLQSGMERRLHQLIRREKRILKSVEEKDKLKVEEEDAPLENKVVSPELYCDICKTSVTCSDQMTMHMNGKRHLAKEKHHILTMMKGQVKNEDEEEDEEEYEGEEQEEPVPEASPADITEGAATTAAVATDADADADVAADADDGDDWGTESWDNNQTQTQEAE